MEEPHSRATAAGQAEAAAHRDSMAEEDAPASILDVSSESFDPLLALYSPQTRLPFPDIRCFNNLAQYESFLRGGGRGSARATERPKKGRKGRLATDPERIERLKKLMLPAEEGAPVRVRKKKAVKNVLTRMAAQARSPLGELNRCVQERIRIRVHIRTFKGLRGVCSGFVVAFDKFWNMAMIDVDETYRKPILGKAFYHEPRLTLNRLFERLKLQESGLEGSAESQGATATKQTLVQSDRPPSPSSRLKKEPGDRTGGTREGAKKEQAGEEGQQRSKCPKDKVDYHQVFTRHMKQVFIRGENVLLVHIGE
ncbi:U7 snRNA-associated Sm-like protein LSm11 [Spea bombifrons]|uniref:U7 snRNA-associated Sm-like protein LSm11 n=1 Tax=Spea bombifrons TaxID=233779 RepID=UPI00234AEB5D|nr:U7 snRNA-associated Sm-like protein LSm11 [Spea bombifrons]